MREAPSRCLGGAGWRIAALALLLLVGCRAEPERISESFFVFGSEATIEVSGVTADVAQPAFADVSADLRFLHQQWHAWDPGPLADLNAALKNGETVPLSPLFRDVIERSLRHAEQSEGLFDPTVGELMQLWGFHTSDFPIVSPPPSAEQLDRWRRADASFHSLTLSDDGLRSDNPLVRLDFGAIAEGMATQRIVAILQRHGISSALIQLGGDLYAIGEPGDRPWRAGLRDPFNNGEKPLAVVDLHSGEALYSSGNYNRYRESPSGSRWPHVVDPRTGLPAAGIVGVNVLHPDPIIADVASTALMVGGESGFQRTLERFGVRCALLMTEHNELMMTAAMAQRLDMRRDPLRLGPLIGTVGPCSEPEPKVVP
jgi:thiamine biosynthesis lipoprotein